MEPGAKGGQRTKGAQSGKQSKQLMLDKADLAETSDNKGEIGTKGDTLAADIAEAIRYSQGMNQLLDNELQLVKDVTLAEPKETNFLKRLC
ncbi:hypothetical protein MMC29_008292 [Sticta canariensis]|nr:hypothetical protein [Sticta canariensis]